MKVHWLDDGDEIQVGDIVVHRHAFGESRYPVVRVTPKFCFVAYNDVANGKYPRVFDARFGSLPRPKWDTIMYAVGRPITQQPQ